MTVLNRLPRLHFASIILLTGFIIGVGWISCLRLSTLSFSISRGDGLVATVVPSTNTMVKRLGTTIIGERMLYQLKYDKFVKFQRHNVNINCSQLLNKNKTEILAVKKSMALHGSANSSLVMYNCSWLKGYLSGNFYVSELEQHFPMAFTLVVHNSPDQVLRLLRILYRDHNSFCIHCDKTSPQNSIFRRIASCFDNIVVPLVQESVVWGHSSILKAEMRCMEEMMKLREKQRWKWEYLLNLCGKEVPLVTNREMVVRLMNLKGRSHINFKVEGGKFFQRIKFGPKLNKDKTKIVSTIKLPKPPFDATRYFYKNSGYHALSFPFVEHLMYNKTALEILQFYYKCQNPEEHFYATIFTMPGVPGGYKEGEVVKQDMVNVIWHPSDCSGRFVHKVCILGAGDLASVVSTINQDSFFHNKYFMEYDDSVMTCMEERYREKNLEDYTSRWKYYLWT